MATSGIAGTLLPGGTTVHAKLQLLKTILGRLLFYGVK